MIKTAFVVLGMCSVTIFLLFRAEQNRKEGEKTPAWVQNAMFWNMGGLVGSLFILLLGLVEHLQAHH